MARWRPAPPAPDRPLVWPRDRPAARQRRRGGSSPRWPAPGNPETPERRGSPPAPHRSHAPLPATRRGRPTAPARRGRSGVRAPDGPRGTSPTQLGMHQRARREARHQSVDTLRAGRAGDLERFLRHVRARSAAPAQWRWRRGTAAPGSSARARPSGSTPRADRLLPPPARPAAEAPAAPVFSDMELRPRLRLTSTTAAQA